MIGPNILSSTRVDGWGGAGATVITSGYAAPDGSITADGLIEDSNPTLISHGVNSPSFVFEAKTATILVEAKAIGRWLYIDITDGIINFADAWVDLIDSVFGNNNNLISSSITDLGSGWRRIQMTFSAWNTLVNNVSLNLGPTNGQIVYSGDGVSGAIINSVLLGYGEPDLPPVPPPAVSLFTGPPYPAPDPRSNEIGRFTIGVSPIGSQQLFDIWETVQSQYANSPIITALIENFASFIDQTANFDVFFDLIMNVDTAVGYGLDVWGRIVGVNRIIKIINPSPYFGFQESNEAVGFDQAPFFSGQIVTTNFILNDQAYRTLILTKAFANISQCSIPMLNKMLLTLFPHRGNAYVTEGGIFGPWFGFKESTDAVGFDQAPFYSGQSFPRMLMTYTFEFALSPLEMAIVKNSGVLPKPTGVKASVIVNA